MGARASLRRRLETGEAEASEVTEPGCAAELRVRERLRRAQRLVDGGENHVGEQLRIFRIDRLRRDLDLLDLESASRRDCDHPAAASFHRQLAEEPKNATLLAEALYEVTGRKLALDFAVGENGGDEPAEEEHPASEEEIVQLMKDTFDAHEVEESPE